MKKINYRTDINGLRGLAVFVILIFHLDIGFLSGGYVGVDIFFVISGFLISNIIYSELVNGTFSLATFYERRARRILPALISILCVCFFVAYLRFFPTEVVAYAKSMIAAALFSANIYFYSALGYFSPAATETPLLHLWSLGVEEQFYILFPLFLMLLVKKSSRFLSTALALSLLISLFISQWMLKINPTAAFYLLPFRAFELLIGAFLALGGLPKLRDKRLTFTLGSLGFLAILYSIFIFNQQTQFPGFSALVPCLGTALIIWAGEHQSGFPNSVLSFYPWQWLGKISYSLYLVHWPIIVFAKRFYNSTEMAGYSISVLALCFLFASLNFYLVEQRFRYLKIFNSQKALMLSATMISFIALSGGTVIYKKGFNHFLNKRLERMLSFVHYNYKPGFKDGTCFQDYDVDPDKADISACLPTGAVEKRVMLWGDSHAAHLYTGLRENLEKEGYSFGMLAASACPPALGIDVAIRPHCKRFNEIAFATIMKEKPSLLILSANWPINTYTFDLLEKTIERLAKENIQMVLLGPSPIFKRSVPVVISEQIKNGELIKATRELLAADYLMDADQKMIKRFGEKKGIKYISVMDTICVNQICPLITADRDPVHFDNEHLTESGSRLFGNKLTPLILDVKTG